MTERHVAEIGQAATLVLGHRIVERVVVEPHVAGSAIASMPGRGLLRQSERSEDKLCRPRRQVAARVVVRRHGLAESLDTVGPAVVVAGQTLCWIDEVEDFLVVASTLGQLTLVVAKGIGRIAADGTLHRAVGAEESLRRFKGLGDDRVEAVAVEKEEPVISACSVEVGERGRSGVVDAHDGHEVHVRRT